MKSYVDQEQAQFPTRPLPKLTMEVCKPLYITEGRQNNNIFSMNDDKTVSIIGIHSPGCLVDRRQKKTFQLIQLKSKPYKVVYFYVALSKQLFY